MHDELVPAKEAAAYWVEHVLRHGGAKHLQARAQNTPFIQHYLLDVWLFLFAVASLILFVLYKLFLFFVRRMFATKVKTQ